MSHTVVDMNPQKHDDTVVVDCLSCVCSRHFSIRVCATHRVSFWFTMASADRAALVALSRATTYDLTSEQDGCGKDVEDHLGGIFAIKIWDPDGALSTWTGVEVNGKGRVVDLNLSFQIVNGEIFSKCQGIVRLCLG